VASFDQFEPGEVIRSQRRTITESLASAAAWLGGYVHPLFTDHELARARLGIRPPLIPGQFVLYLLGGLAEMTGRFDDTTVGLVALDDVRFERPVEVGDTISLRMEVLDKSRSPSGRRGSVRFSWEAIGPDDQPRVRADATMLFTLPGAPEVT
jgi:acyl dehydratase